MVVTWWIVTFCPVYIKVSAVVSHEKHAGLTSPIGYIASNNNENFTQMIMYSRDNIHITVCFEIL